MTPKSRDDARSLLQKLGAPAHLLRHVELVGEAADLLLQQLRDTKVPVDEDIVRVGVVLHDAGKIEHPAEMIGPGSEHEPDGEKMLLAAGVTPSLARICLSHARWASMDCSLEELLVALSDKLWKGVRLPDLEQQVIEESAHRAKMDRWDIFVPLDSCFEKIADAGNDRLSRSTS